MIQAVLLIALGFLTASLIGVFVGPMAVAFLQVLLEMLNTELDAWSKTEGAKTKISAADVGERLA